MNKVTIKSMPFKLKGEAIKIGDKLEFKAKDKDNKDLSISSLKGNKIISIFPDINTKVCDLQTHKLSVIAQAHPKLNIISITMDDVKTISEWCHASGVSNLIILSDKEHGEFGNKTNLLIPMINKLSRGFILLDENNIVKDLTLNTELAELPDFDKVESWIK